ncbi:MAG: hypothetical protein B6229_06235 [Spirochaetaceae bacterium 4572_7]|nr:MAG: hypothetical protein B6229_06235 [Spirochaetaceae bacterium 4572_7]
MVGIKSTLDDKIEALEQQLNTVKGRETEKYARIVGYYRAVKNWNKGKKEEYKFRVNFSETTFNPKMNGTVDNNSANVMAKKDIKPKSNADVASYKFFYRTTCPNCPPVKNIVEDLKLDGESINADTSKGFTKAAIFEIFTAPTVIFLDSKGTEITRASNISDLKEILTERNVA